MTNVTVANALPALLLALNVTAVPADADVGVPVMAPVFALRKSPPGNDPLVIENVGAGLPVAASV